MGKERLCIGELAAWKNVHRTTVYDWISRGLIPRNFIHHGINGRAYFLKSEIETLETEIDKGLHNTTLPYASLHKTR